MNLIFLKWVNFMERVELDEIDIKILRTLQRDARNPFANIAEKSGVSTDTIIRRFNKMKKEGIISGTTLLLNPKKFGYEYIASFSINVNLPHIKEVIKFIQEIPEVLLAVPLIGRDSLFILAIFKEINRLGEVRDLIKSHPHVKNIGINIWVGEVLLCPENFDLNPLKK